MAISLHKSPTVGGTYPSQVPYSKVSPYSGGNPRTARCPPTVGGTYPPKSRTARCPPTVGGTPVQQGVLSLTSIGFKSVENILYITDVLNSGMSVIRSSTILYKFHIDRE